MTFHPPYPTESWCVSLTQAVGRVSLSCSRAMSGLDSWCDERGRNFRVAADGLAFPQGHCHRKQIIGGNLELSKESSVSTWFKFYPRDLRSPQFQYCQRKQPFIAGIYLWCLCQCAEEGAESFPWLDSAVEYDGLASTLHITYEQAKSGIGLLIDAKLISYDMVGIKVKGWQDHQSDYMGRRAYFSKRYEKSTVKHSEARLEKSTVDRSTEDFSVQDRKPTGVPKYLLGKFKTKP